MDMHLYRLLVFRVNSDEGQKKCRFFQNNRIICPSWRDLRMPHFRTSWETIQELIADHKESIVKDLESCEIDGKESASIFSSLSVTSPLEEYAHGITKTVLPALLPEYDPHCGFDLDAFLVVNDELRPMAVTEVFPRFSHHDPDFTAYASKLSMMVPLVERRGIERDNTRRISALVYIGAKESGETDVRKIADKWMNFRGTWPVQQKKYCDLLINIAVSSIIELGHEGKRPIVVPEMAFDRETGKGESAKLHFTFSKPQDTSP